jgi:hypothetical protein
LCPLSLNIYSCWLILIIQYLLKVGRAQWPPSYNAALTRVLISSLAFNTIEVTWHILEHFAKVGVLFDKALKWLHTLSRDLIQCCVVATDWRV